MEMGVDGHIWPILAQCEEMWGHFADFLSCLQALSKEFIIVFPFLHFIGGNRMIVTDLEFIGNIQ